MRVLRKGRKLRQLCNKRRGRGYLFRCWQLLCLFFLIVFVFGISLCVSVTYFFNWALILDRSFLLNHEVASEKLVSSLPSFLHPLFSLYLDQFPTSLTSDSRQTINVHVIPFSHTDPGWLASKNAYYHSIVRDILNAVVKNLYKENDSTFIWTENIFLQEWLEESGDDKRNMLLKLLDAGRFEISYPGFVMQDEALPDLRESVSNFMAGALWLKFALNTSVQSSFVADPFGVTSSCAYLQGLFNVSSLYVQRVNYREKELLAADRNLEFWWKAGYQNASLNQLTSINPFKLYAVPYSCGPEPRKCCAFDFWRSHCNFHFPWQHSWSPKQIQKSLGKHLHLLAEQLHLKGSLYRTSEVPLLLGDDFRFASDRAWEMQIGNYRRIMEIFSQESAYGIKMKFSTLSQYFSSVKQERKSSKLMNFTGDFVPYTDRWSEFWSGYYTTRPFLKNAGNRLWRLIFAIENIISFCFPSSSCNFVHQYNETLENAKNLALNFLHHDLITGTARKHVVKDHRRSLLKYENKLFRNVLPAAIAELTRLRLTIQESNERKSVYAILNDEFTVFRGPLFLKMEDLRTECIDAIAWFPNQSSWRKVHSFLDQDYLVVDQVDLQPMSVTLVKTVKQYSDCQFTLPNKDKILESEEFVLSNNRYELSFRSFQPFKIKFSKAGEKQMSEISLSVDFETFGTFINPPLSYISNPSGAYIFTHDGTRRKLLRTCEGEYLIRTDILHSFRTICKTASINYTLFQNKLSVAGSVILLDVGFDITGSDFSDVELAIVISTGLESRLRFYTDSNGMFPVRRQYRGKLSLPGNVYPISTYVQITDGTTWVTITTEHARGVTSTADGELVLFLDRRHQHDDWRGLNEGINDNEYMKTKLWLSVAQSQEDGIWLSSYLRNYPLVLPIKSTTELLLKPDISPISQNIFFRTAESGPKVKCPDKNHVNASWTRFACKFRIVHIYNHLPSNSTFYTIQRLPSWQNEPNEDYCSLRLNFGALQENFNDFASNFEPHFFEKSNPYQMRIFKLAC